MSYLQFDLPIAADREIRAAITGRLARAYAQIMQTTVVLSVFGGGGAHATSYTRISGSACNSGASSPTTSWVNRSEDR